MAMPPAVVHGRPRPRAAEAREAAGKDAPRESGPRWTGGRRPAPPARQMGQLTASGVALAHLPQDALHGGDGCEHTSTPRGRPTLPTHREHGVRVLPRGPLACTPVQDGGETRDHRGTYQTVRVVSR